MCVCIWVGHKCYILRPIFAQLNPSSRLLTLTPLFEHKHVRTKRLRSLQSTSGDLSFELSKEIYMFGVGGGRGI